MRPLMSYFLAYYLRSYRYLFPVCAYVGFILFVYSMVPNPVMDSYALSAMLLFLVSAWISYGFVDLEHESQRFVTAGRSGSAARYYGAKYLVMLGIGASLGILAVAYPVAFDKFDRLPSLGESAAAALAHLVLASLGITCALWFSEKMMASRTTAFFGLMLVLAVSCGGKGLGEQLPEGVRGVLWLIPPVSRVTEILFRYDEISHAWTASVLLLAAFYSGILLLAFIRVNRIKLF
ncbi:hypothetical protein [Cohnella thailandensis]|uniref:Uncharacterized protein n=1 Tax=Cohnella thailandensis TaxID=557557 RepID=A0A841T5V5_9BACL|nr:hypothetical protein [Cohnella thailandensis]MBB6636511.1 hypothetical protein [Cohnella thailandensis]MBP1977617.1 hypothetical protein [Cohnella thailandensis]